MGLAQGITNMLYAITVKKDHSVVVLPPASQNRSRSINLRRLSHGKHLIVRPSDREIFDGGEATQYVLDDDHEYVLLVSDGTCWWVFMYSR